jgi:Ca2+-binding EF-hand superfamily protein
VKIASIKFHFENSFLKTSESSKGEKNNNSQEEIVTPFHLLDKDGKICSGEVVEIFDNNEFKPVLHVDEECESTLEDEDFSYILKEFEAQKKNQKPKKQAVDTQKSNI